MKKIWFLTAAALWPAALLNAQTDGMAKDVQLQEAVVKGARVVSRPDGTLIYPSEEMKNAATSGYNLLRMMPLPNAKVDDVNESIVALNSLVGAVQVRIKGVVATANDLRSLSPKEVAKVEFVDRPGVRYGEEVGIVINIVTHRVTAGYAMGADAKSAPKADMLRGSAYAKLNSENSEFSINYSGAYSQMDGMHTAERTDYQMGDIGFKLTWSLTKGRQVKGVERDVEGAEGHGNWRDEVGKVTALMPHVGCTIKDYIRPMSLRFASAFVLEKSAVFVGLAVEKFVIFDIISYKSLISKGFLYLCSRNLFNL